MPALPDRDQPAAGDMPADGGFGIYFHWPFCAAKCPYCDFNSHVREHLDESRWRQALLRELDHFAALTPGRRVSSVFFGGGTPSLMSPPTVASMIDRIADLWPLAGDPEITLEANPTSVEADRFEGFRVAGVNRLSLGVQALDDEALKFLGRRHSAAEALVALELAKRHFSRVSFDLIYARPGQTAASWRAELGNALAIAPGHLSLYQLTIERGTPFHALWRGGALRPPDGDAAAGLYAITHELCADAGLERYEVSNHAVPGEESRHNLNYWRYGEYAGIGPGAHGRLRLNGGRRVFAANQIRDPDAWLAAVEDKGHGTAGSEPLSGQQQAAEMIMVGLRIPEGLLRSRFETAIGRPVDDFISATGLAALVEGNFVDCGGGRIRVTDRGMPVLDSVLGSLLASRFS